MEIQFTKQSLIGIINEDVSRLAARSYAEDGSSLYDGIKITSRDSGVQERMLEKRDARLRDLLAFCLVDEEPAPAPDEEPAPVETLQYNLSLDNVKASTLASLKVLMREYLTDGVLYDWYTRHGIPSSIKFEDVEAMETKIVCMVRQGFVKKPLQPFGPRN